MTSNFAPSADPLAGTTALAADAPLGAILFYEGYEDAPQCPCGNDVQGDGFRPVVAAESADGKVGEYADCDGAWQALGRHVACMADYCLRVWSDSDITVTDDTKHAPVLFRLHHVEESAAVQGGGA